VKKFPAFSGTRRFITMLKRSRLSPLLLIHMIWGMVEFSGLMTQKVKLFLYYRNGLYE
jgi:hypothetical protein